MKDNIIFLPFLICGISIVGRYIALLLNKKKVAQIFHKLFSVGFFLFWFGFLTVAAYLCIRDKNYGTLVFTVPFWIAGIAIARKRLLPDQYKKKSSKKSSKVNIPIIISAFLVIITLIAGIIILTMGIKQRSLGLIFTGGFFFFGAFTFILFFFTVQGYFDTLKIDVLGLYMGVLIAVIGIGVIMIKYAETYSLTLTLETFGIWILIPLLMFAVGSLQIVKCLKNRRC